MDGEGHKIQNPIGVESNVDRYVSLGAVRLDAHPIIFPIFLILSKKKRPKKLYFLLETRRTIDVGKAAASLTIDVVGDENMGWFSEEKQGGRASPGRYVSI